MGGISSALQSKPSIKYWISWSGEVYQTDQRGNMQKSDLFASFAPEEALPVGETKLAIESKKRKAVETEELKEAQRPTKFRKMEEGKEAAASAASQEVVLFKPQLQLAGPAWQGATEGLSVIFTMQIRGNTEFAKRVNQMREGLLIIDLDAMTLKGQDFIYITSLSNSYQEHPQINKSPDLTSSDKEFLKRLVFSCLCWILAQMIQHNVATKTTRILLYPAGRRSKDDFINKEGLVAYYNSIGLKMSETTDEMEGTVQSVLDVCNREARHFIDSDAVEIKGEWKRQPKADESKT